MNIPNEFTLCYSHQMIQDRIAHLGKEIGVWVKEAEARTGHPVLAVCVLRGAVFFFTDLLRAIPVSVEPSFCRTWGYSTETNAKEHGVRVWIDDVLAKGRAVLLVDDICDTGATMLKLQNMILELGAKEVRSVVTILREVDAVKNKPSWSAFQYTGVEWFVGYGMDDRDSFRNLPDIYTLQPR